MEVRRLKNLLSSCLRRHVISPYNLLDERRVSSRKRKSSCWKSDSVKCEIFLDVSAVGPGRVGMSFEHVLRESRAGDWIHSRARSPRAGRNGEGRRFLPSFVTSGRDRVRFRRHDSVPERAYSFTRLTSPLCIIPTCTYQRLIFPVIYYLATFLFAFPIVLSFSRCFVIQRRGHAGNN